MAMTRTEASFLEQTQAWHAGGAGRDLDAAVHLFRDPSGANAAVEHLEWFHQEDSESSVDVLIEVDDDDEHIADGCTRLMFAASRGWCSSIKWLLENGADIDAGEHGCLLYTSPSPRDKRQSRMPSSA